MDRKADLAARRAHMRVPLRGPWHWHAAGTLLSLLLILVANFPATAAGLECNQGTGSFQQLCRLGDVDFPSSFDHSLPPPEVLDPAWRSFVQARMAVGRPLSVLEISAGVAEDSAALNTYVDSVLQALPEVSALAPPDKVRAQLRQVALCPWLLLEDKALANSQPCTFSALTPATLTHRKDIVALLKVRHGEACGQPVCMDAPPLPTQIITTLIDWAPALEAEMQRLPACEGSDVAGCTEALTNSTLGTAGAVVVQALITDWASMREQDRCLIEVGRIAGIDVPAAMVNQSSGVNASLVANLLQSPDQLARRQLTESAKQWRALAVRIRRRDFDAASLLNHCAAKEKETVQRYFGEAAAPRLDSNGRLPNQPWRMEQGYVDFPSSGDGPLAALRLRYSAPPVNGRCEASPPIGRLSLIIRARIASRQWLAHEVPAGVDDIRLPGLCGTPQTLDKSVLTLSVQQVGTALRQLVPPPLQLTVTSGRMDYQAGAVPGQLRLHVEGRLGVTGIGDTVAVAWDLGSSPIDLNRQALLMHAREAMQAYLQPRLGTIKLALTPPDNCTGHGLPVPDERALALYTCMDLSHNMGLLDQVPTVLLQIELDGSGRTLFRMSPPALAALRDPMLNYVRKEVDDYLDGELGKALADVALDAIPTGVRLRIPVQLKIDNTPFDWTVSVDLHFSGGDSLKEQIKRQLGDLEQHKTQLRDVARTAAMQRFNTALQSFDLPGIKVKSVNWKENRVDLMLSTPIPNLEQVEFFVSLDSSNVSDALREAALMGIQRKLDLKEVDYAGLQLEKLRVHATPWRLTAEMVFNARPALSATVTLPLSGDFRPHVEADGMRDALRQLMAGELSKLAGNLLGSIPPLKVEWVNNVPEIRIEISSSLRIIGDMPFEGMLTALLTQREGLQLKTITVRCTTAMCWYPVSFLEIGNFALTANPHKLAGLKFEATAAITRANETMRLLRLDSALTVDDPVRLDARLTLLNSWEIGQFSAALDINRARLEMEGTMRFPIIDFNISQSKILIDGNSCVVVGWVKDDIVGLVEAEMIMGLRYAKCGKLDSSEPLVIQLLAICGDASNADAAICAKGEAIILGSSLRFSLAMPLKPLGSPVAHARVEVWGIGLETEIRKSYVRMHANAGRLASVTLLMPPLGKFSSADVKALLEQALRPKLSWEAFKRREVVLSMLPPDSSNGDVASGDQRSLAGPADYKRSSTAPAERRAATAQSTITSTRRIATGRLGMPFIIDCTANQLYGPNPVYAWKISPEVCSRGYSAGHLIASNALLMEAQGYAVFCETEACDLRKPMLVSRLFPADSSAVATSRSFQVGEAIATLFDASTEFALLNLDGLLQRIGSAQFDAAVSDNWSKADAVCVRRAARGNASSACRQALVVAGLDSWIFGVGLQAKQVAEGSWLHHVLGKRRAGNAPLRQVFGEQLDALEGVAGYVDDRDAIVLAQPGEAPWLRWWLNSEGVWQGENLETSARFPKCGEGTDQNGDPVCMGGPCTGTSIHQPTCASSSALVAEIIRNPMTGERCSLSPNGVSWCGPAEQDAATVTRSLLVVTDSQGKARVLSQPPQCLRTGALQWQKDGWLTDIVARDGQDDIAFLRALDDAVKLWRSPAKQRGQMRADPSLLYLRTSANCRSGK